MTEQANPPATESEVLDGVRLVKRALAAAAFIYTPIMILVAWYLDASTIVWILVGAIAVIEFAGYPLWVRVLDRNAEENIAKLREEQGLTPKAQLPDVGV